MRFLILALLIGGCASTVVSAKKYKELCDYVDNRVANPIYFAVDEATYEAMIEQIFSNKILVGLDTKDSDRIVPLEFGQGIGFVKATAGGAIELGKVYGREEINNLLPEREWSIGTRLSIGFRSMKE